MAARPRTGICPPNRRTRAARPRCFGLARRADSRRLAGMGMARCECDARASRRSRHGTGGAAVVARVANAGAARRRPAGCRVDIGAGDTCPCDDEFAPTVAGPAFVPSGRRRDRSRVGPRCRGGHGCARGASSDPAGARKCHADPARERPIGRSWRRTSSGTRKRFGRRRRGRDSRMVMGCSCGCRRGGVASRRGTASGPSTSSPAT
jgi:hypothetical protein